jgi:hypothetical protein
MANPIDIVTAKVKGAQRGMEARREGLVGVFQTLARQHGEAAALVDRVKGDPDKRGSLWPKIKIALIAHEQAELAAVYPALAHHRELQDLVERHGREARSLEDMITRLDSTTVDRDEWMSLLVSLGETVRAHAAYEEDDIFPTALEAIGAHAAKQLEDAFKAAYKDLEASLEQAVH